MLPSSILKARRNAVRDIMKRYPRLSNLRICGSVARGEDSEHSDIDFLVDPEPGATLFDLGGLHEDLEELLGVRVDIISARGRLDGRLRESLLKDATPV